MTDSNNSREQDPSIRHFPGEYLDRAHHLSRARMVARDSVRATVTAETPPAVSSETPRPMPEVQRAIQPLPTNETTAPANSAGEFNREAEVRRHQAQVAEAYEEAA